MIAANDKECRAASGPHGLVINNSLQIEHVMNVKGTCDQCVKMILLILISISRYKHEKLDEETQRIYASLHLREY